VKDIVDKLHEKLGKNYSVEKLNTWAHMINMGKHNSYDISPNLSYFGKHPHAEQPFTLSPAKRIQLRSKCIDNLGKLHAILEKGGVPSDQFDTLQKAILGDLQNFQRWNILFIQLLIHCMLFTWKCGLMVIGTKWFSLLHDPRIVCMLSVSWMGDPSIAMLSSDWVKCTLKDVSWVS